MVVQNVYIITSLAGQIYRNDIRRMKTIVWETVVGGVQDEDTAASDPSHEISLRPSLVNIVIYLILGLTFTA